jgi:ferredoxin/menaquinone-dependent protoporphyrinogen IX oxidase
MNINSVKLIYFSPTGTTKQVVEAIAKGIQASSGHLDLTPPAAQTREFEELHNELAVIAAPVYGGRVPLEAANRLRRLKGNETLAVIVVVYGNRAYEDALLELSDIASEVGFKPVAGAVFIGAHMLSPSEKPVVSGRPDARDLEKALEFGKKVRKKIGGIGGLKDISPLEVPGNRPYRKRWGPGEPASPLTTEELCVKCGRCAEVCPVAAVTVGTVVTTQQDACIWCCACVKYCPSGARVREHPRMLKTIDWMRTNYHLFSEKEPEIYL